MTDLQNSAFPRLKREISDRSSPALKLSSPLTAVLSVLVLIARDVLQWEDLPGLSRCFS